MIDYPASLLATGGAHTGVAPVNLLDIQDVNGNVYLWADRKILAPSPLVAALTAMGATTGLPTSPAGAESGFLAYKPWLLRVPKLTFHRSLQTDVGSFTIQNLSGDTLSRDVEKQVRRSTLEGAFFVYRLWQPDAEAAWLYAQGTLTVDPLAVDTGELKSKQLLNPAEDDTPLEIYCETCQLQWGGARCGATGTTECSYSFQTCQVVERIMVDMNNFEKNYGEAQANTVLNVINRRRTI